MSPRPGADADVVRQVFRRPGDYAGPLAFVSTGPLEQLDVGLDGRTGRLDTSADPVEWFEDGVRTRVVPLGDGQAVRVDALGLAADDVAAFADGLERRDAPPAWEATVLPAGLEELRTGPPPPPDAPYSTRVVNLAFGPEQRAVRILAETTGGAGAPQMEAVFLFGVGGRRAAAGDDDVQQVEVLGRPALLVGASGPEPELLWRHTTTGLVDLHLPAADPATLAELVDGIRELTPEEWDQLTATVPHGT